MTSLPGGRETAPGEGGRRTRDHARRSNTASPRRRGFGQGLPWLLMVPALVVLLLMTIFPAAYLLWASLHGGTLLGGNGQFVGLQNYVDVLTSVDRLKGFALILVFVVVAVSIQTALGLALAVPLSAQTRSSNIATTIALVPFAVTPVVSALVFRELFNPNYGWVGYFMGLVGLPDDIAWLSSTPLAWVLLIGIDVWQWTPFVALILMAGLKSVPQEPVEAAAIDGASGWQIFRYVKLPMILPFMAIAVVLRTIQAFKTFDSFKVLTNGGPGTSTEIINLEIYRVALQSFRIGAASAIAIVFLILLLTLVPLLLRAVGRGTDEEGV
ncbi:carbohydrate ABC transporter permease [Cellulomonas fimi]|nr:sugar ABC transporter permease [Cellulomonas fimi]